MRLTQLTADGFKNLRGVAIAPDPAYNLILGENAQGTGLSPLLRRCITGGGKASGQPQRAVCAPLYGARRQCPGKALLVQ